MNKHRLKQLVVVVLASSSGLFAVSEFRSPLSLYRGPIWYELPAQDDGKWVIDSWDGLYCRSASDAYVPDNTCGCPATFCTPSCCNNQSATLLEKDACGCVSHGSTRHKEQLSTLFFGKSVFRVEEAFAGGQLDMEQSPQGPPSISFSHLAPRFEYSEQGLVCGMHVHRKLGIDRSWRIGMRASLPFKDINVKRRSDCQLAESFDDVMNLDIYNPACTAGDSNTLMQTFAYRLDFLSSLATPVLSTCGGTQTSFVHYGEGGVNPCTDDVTKIGGVDVGPIAGDKPVVVFYSPSDCIPGAPKPLLVPAPQPINLNGVLDESGTTYNGGNPLVPGQWYVFDSTKDYANDLGMNRDAQDDLWIGPNFDPINPLPAAQSIHETVQFILNTLDATGKESAEYFLNSKCIFMRDRRIIGVGDLDTEMYVGYHAPKNWFADTIFGVRYPTGKKNSNPGDLLYVTTGNNGHFEVKGAVEGGWNPNKWVAIKTYLSGTHVCSRAEKRPVTFTGSTIRNINPVIDVDVSYNYFLGNLDFTFYHPEHNHLGCAIGYELYAKGRDKVACCKTPCEGNACGCGAGIAEVRSGKATDLLGFQREIDCSLLSCGTDTMTHKIRGEVFHRCVAGYFDLFGGVSQVIGGRYAMRETEAHIGVAVNF